jgi:signal transduction histidine kinase
MTAAAARALQRLGRTPEWVVDAALATLVVLVGLFTAARQGSDPSGPYRDRDAVAVLLILASTVPYYARRRAPLAVFITTAGAVTALMLLDHDAGSLPWVLMLGAYTVGAYCSARQLVAAAVLISAALATLLAAGAAGFAAGDAVSSAAAFGGAMLLGRSMQARRRRIDAFDEEQAQAALRAAADERLRIAQELHDVVAHSLGVIAVQAGVGMHVIDSDPEEARRSLEHISRTSRSSLAEIRRLLGMIRNAEGTPAYTPAPGLADLPRLVDEVCAAGLPVEVTVEGDLDDIPAGLGLAAYRIVQEALTNALRHAGAGRADVRLTGAGGELLIEVCDDGGGPNGGSAGGHGLVGMRERVALFGGSLAAGPGADGGFRVVARLPYDAEPVP